jgi:hypothetical protein
MRTKEDKKFDRKGQASPKDPYGEFSFNIPLNPSKGFTTLIQTLFSLFMYFLKFLMTILLV